jgi:hypothetical protein
MISSMVSLSWICQRPSFSGRKSFLQYGRITGIRKLGIQVITDEVEEGFEVGIAGVLGYLFAAIVQLYKKREDFVRRD